MAPSENASSFVVTVLMPFAAAASSSSRMAFQERPIRESCNRYMKIIANVTIRTIRNRYGSGEIALNGPSVNGPSVSVSGR